MKTIPTIDRSEVPQALQSAEIVANLTSLDCPVPTTVRCVVHGSDRLEISDETRTTAPPVDTNQAAALGEMLGELEQRIAILAAPDCTVARTLAEQRSPDRPELAILHIDSDVDASSFMDAGDADEVAERLRQLGYL